MLDRDRRSADMGPEGSYAELVEIEITDQMIGAGVEAYCLFQHGDPPDEIVREIYRAMSAERVGPAGSNKARATTFDGSVAPVLNGIPEQHSLRYQSSTIAIGRVVQKLECAIWPE